VAFFTNSLQNSTSYCLAVYAAAVPASPLDKVTTLDPGMGKNYGAALAGPVQVAPVGHSAETYGSEYVASLLHWKSDPEQYLRTAFPKQRPPLTTSVALPGGEEIHVKLLDLRPEVRRRHDLVNLALVNGLGSLSLLLGVFLVRVWATYKRCQQECLTYGRHVTASEFLLQDVSKIMDGAREQHAQKLEQSQQQGKAEALLRRLQDETRAKLEALLGSQLPDAQKQRIQASLSKKDIEEMRTLTEELRNIHLQKSPEERLNALLEPLKTYCNADEFNHYQQETLETLYDRGFREARVVTKTFAELRFRAKRSGQDETADSTP
jgi:hypothetical protein